MKRIRVYSDDPTRMNWALIGIYQVGMRVFENGCDIKELRSPKRGRYFCRAEVTIPRDTAISSCSHLFVGRSTPVSFPRGIKSGERYNHMAFPRGTTKENFIANAMLVAMEFISDTQVPTIPS